MSNKSRLQTNNTNLQELINKANALPDAGGGGGSVESCTITITPYIMLAPTSPTYWYTDAETITIKSLSTQDATIAVPKNSIIVILGWSSDSTTTGSCSQIFYNSMYAAYQITGDCAFKYGM